MIAFGGTNKKVIDESLFSTKEVANELVSSIDQSIEDLFRARTDTVWHTGEQPKFKTTSTSNIPIKVVSIEKPKKTQNNGIFGEITQKIVIEPNKNLFKFNPGEPLVAISHYNKALWRAFIQKQVIQRVPTNNTIREPVQEQPSNPFIGEVDSSLNTTLRDELTSQPISTSLQQQNTNQLPNTARVETGPFQLSQGNTNPFNNVRVNEGPQLQNTAQRPEFNVVLPDGTQQFNIEPTFQFGKVFFDHVFSMSIPQNRKNIEKLGLSHGISFVDVKSEYNFFIDEYEKAINDVNVPETIIPHMYSFLTELRSENTDAKNTIFQQLITLAGSIPNQYVDIINNKGEKIGESGKGEYFDEYGRRIFNFVRTKPTLRDNLNRKFSNQALPITEIDLFKEFNDKRELFPMFFDIQFTTDRTTQFAEILKDSQLSAGLAKSLIDSKIPLESSKFYETINETVKSGGVFLSKTKTESKTMNVYDITGFVKQLVETPFDDFENLQNGVFLGRYNDEIQRAQNKQFDLHKNLLVIIFAGKMKSLIEREMRSFEDILNGKLSYSETAAYRIEKIETNSGRVLQNFWLPNSNDIDVLRFIDTQVKYNKQYTYRIFAYEFVIGTKYRYDIEELGDASATVNVVMEPSLKLVEVLFHEFTGRIMDNPPIAPDVNVVPFRTVNNQIKFMLNSNTGHYFLEPIIIQPSDVEIIQSLREAQMIDENEFLEYETDDHASAFEIFRTSKHPKTWRDFEGKRIALVSTDVNGLTLQKATAASFVDDILPNKKYYYTFRTIDNHGHVSNPTPIYELELVDNDGAVYPVIKIVDFDKKEKIKSTVKSGRRFIQIVPSFTQTILDEEKSGLIENGKRIETVANKEKFHLGIADEGVWNKSFKVRLTSKQTGKKIDLNISFIHNHLKVDE